MFGKRHAKRGPGSLADTVRDIRHLNELTQTEFGKLVGVSQAAICKWEAGIDRPGLDILSRLVELSDIATAKKLVKASGLGRFIDVFNKKLESDNAAQ
jgi:transcriptional regulator with XRE-family HTH domain